MPRSAELSKELRDIIYTLYVTNHMSEPACVDFINDEKNNYLSKLGKVSVSDVHYHVVKIRQQLDESIDHDALDRYTAEYVRIQHALEHEIEAVEKTLALIDPKEKPDVWMRLRRLKKDLMIDKIRVLQDHELPLTVRKFKKERDKKIGTIKVAVPLPKPDFKNTEEDGTE
jgi:hypothetical protein